MKAAWWNEGAVCQLFCIRRLDPASPLDMGSEYPDTECDVHWAPEWQAYRNMLHARRLAHWRNWRAGRVARGR